MNALLEVRDAVAFHGRLRALGGVSFSLEPGKLCAVLGPNGAGKSTLLRTILGVHPLASGQVSLKGRPISSWPRRALAQTVAWVPQQVDASSGFTALEVVLMGRTPHLSLLGLPSEKDRRRAEDILASLEVASLSERPFSTLSGGEQRLVLLARALLQDPELLLLDEPTAFLDVHHQVELLRRLRGLAREGMAALAVLHEVNLAAAFAEQVVLLKGGMVAGAGEASFVLTEERLGQLYGLPVDRAETKLGQPVFAPRADRGRTGL